MKANQIFLWVSERYSYTCRLNCFLHFEIVSFGGKFEEKITNFCDWLLKKIQIVISSFHSGCLEELFGFSSFFRSFFLDCEPNIFDWFWQFFFSRVTLSKKFLLRLLKPFSMCPVVLLGAICLLFEKKFFFFFFMGGERKICS